MKNICVLHCKTISLDKFFLNFSPNIETLVPVYQKNMSYYSIPFIDCPLASIEEASKFFQDCPYEKNKFNENIYSVKRDHLTRLYTCVENSMVQ
jgi:hypothetical protein